MSVRNTALRRQAKTLSLSVCLSVFLSLLLLLACLFVCLLLFSPWSLRYQISSQPSWKHKIRWSNEGRKEMPWVIVHFYVFMVRSNCHIRLPISETVNKRVWEKKCKAVYARLCFLDCHFIYFRFTDLFFGQTVYTHSHGTRSHTRSVSYRCHVAGFSVK